MSAVATLGGALLCSWSLACASSSSSAAPGDPGSASAALQPWASAIAGTAAVSGQAIAVDGDAVVVAGSFESSLADARPVLHSSGATDGYVRFLDRDGRVVWTRGLGGMGADAIRAVAVHAPGPDRVAITAALTHGDAIDLSELATAPGMTPAPDDLAFAGHPDSATALITFDGRGRLTRVTPLRASRHVHVNALAYREDGSLILAGLFAGTLRVGDHVLTSAGASDLFVARIAAAGQVSWALRAGGAGADSARGVAVSPSLLAVAGSFSGRADFAATPLVAPRRNRRFSGQSGFVAALDPDTGALRWARPLVGPATSAAAVAISDQVIACAGYFEGPMKLGETTLDARGATDAFAVGFDHDGQALWFTRLGGDGHDHATAITAQGDRFVVAGTFHGRVTAGDHTLTSAGERDLFIGTVAAGKVLTMQSHGGPAHDGIGGVVADPDGLYLTGTFTRTIEIAGLPGPLRATASLGAFVARLRP